MSDDFCPKALISYLINERGHTKEEAVSIAMRMKGIIDSANRRELVENAVLTSKGRKGLPDSAFADPKNRKFPIQDAPHVRNAAARFNQAKPRPRSSVKSRICAAAKKFNIESDFCKSSNETLEIESNEEARMGNTGYPDAQQQLDVEKTEDERYESCLKKFSQIGKSKRSAMTYCRAVNKS